MSPVEGKLLKPRRGLTLVERRAWNCLERCRRKLKLESIPLPVPVEEWIEFVFRIGFGVEDLSRLGDNVLGAAYLKDREISISETLLGNEGRFRFTCAHELGHFMLHAKLASAFRDTLDMELRGLTLIERQADRFAAAFLMPLMLLERELVNICQERKLEVRTTLTELMVVSAPSERLWRYVFLPEVTRRFGVSAHAALLRFQDLLLVVSRKRPFIPAVFVEKLRPRIPRQAGTHPGKAGQPGGVQMSLFDTRT